MQQYGQIKDHQGNTIAASKASRALYDAGWRICWLERKGMFKRVLWTRLADPERAVFDQAQAVLIQKELTKAQKKALKD